MVMKKLVSVCMALVMCMVLCVPAFAAETSGKVSVARVSQGLMNEGYVVKLESVDTIEDSAMQEAVQAETRANVARVIPDLVTPRVAPICVEVYPLIEVPEEGGALYTLIDHRRYKTLSGTAQSEYFGLDAAATASYINGINASLALFNAQNGYTAEFIGWQITCSIQMTATRPNYIELVPSRTSITGTDPVRENIPSNYTTCTYTLTRGLEFTSPDLTAYQTYGFTGEFNITYANGTRGGLYVGTGFQINK